jgi:radical SAM superfamily enzyme YgiQ (UPF0313 family)
MPTRRNKGVAFLIPHYEGRNHSPFLGIGYLSQVLKQAGFDTLILDEDAIYFVMGCRGEKNPIQAAKHFILDKLSKFSPTVLCVTINTANYERCLELLETVRAGFPKTCLIVGGPHISTSWHVFKKFHPHLFDLAVVGEGELTLVDVCHHVVNQASLEGIPGTILSNGCEDSYRPRELIGCLDMLPYPDREGFFRALPEKDAPFLHEHYRRVFYNHLPGFKGRRYQRIVGSRGCDFSCTFCSPSAYWQDPFTGRPRRRVRSPVSIVDEMEYLVDQGCDAFYFDDPTFPFNSKPDFIDRLIRNIEERGLNIAWSGPTRYDELSKDILVRLARTGFTYTYFGLETCRRSDLHKMGKEMDINQCLRLIEWCNDVGIHCDVSYQIGLPGDDYKNIIKSIQWLEENSLQRRSFFSIAAIWPETPLAINYGLSSEAYEPECDKIQYEKRGLYFFRPGDPRIENYFSNCSGTFHFINIDTAIQVKYYLLDAGFIKRFDQASTFSKSAIK